MRPTHLRTHPSAAPTLALPAAIGTVLLYLTLATGPSATAQSARSASLEEASAIAEQLLREREDPVAAAMARVEVERLQALEAESAIALRRAHAGVPTGDGREQENERKDAFQGYAKSVVLLAHVPDPRTLPAIEDAARSSDPGVRYSAMLALREGASAKHPHSAALAMARTASLADPDPRVRRQAFEAFRRWGAEADVLALSQELGRISGPVRDLAVREWIRIEEERNAR